MKLFGPLKALFPYPIDERYFADKLVDLPLIAALSNSYDYMKVVCKEDGNTYELQPDKKWKLFTAKGQKGDPGKSLEFTWSGTKLGVRLQGDTNYQYTELKGATGKALEFLWSGTELGVRQEGETNYQFTDLKGKQGDPGQPGPKPTDAELVTLFGTTEYQNLNTEAKTIVEAINELKGKLDNILLQLPEGGGTQ